MSDYAEVLVFNVDAAELVARALVDKLVRAKIIVSKKSDCTLGERGHRPGNELETAATNAGAVRRLRTNGLEVRTAKAVELYFSPDGGAPWVTCVECNNRLSDDAMIIALEKWSVATCGICGDARSIASWTIHDGAFGNLALFFWGWNLRPGFVAQVQTWAKAPVVLVGYLV